MAILTVYDEQFPCSVAMKGDDYIRLLDEEGNVVFFADGITDFSPYILDGSWEYPYKRSATIVSCTAVLVDGVLTLTPRAPTKIESFTTLVFQAPCDCNMFSSLSICDKTYDIVDAMGNSIIGGGSTWCKNAYVSLLIDCVNQKAYVLNESSRDYAKRVSGAYNLLDNSDFTNPVNQRGVTHSGGSGVYSIDRWLTSSSSHSIDVVDGGIVVTGAVRQYVLNVKEGNVYTVAVKDVSGNLYVYSEPYYESGRIGDPEYVTLTKSVSTGYATFQLMEHSSAWEWAALYEGEYTADTLPPYVPKGYTAELAECQRYFERLNDSTERRKIGDYITVTINSKTCKTILNYRPKRVFPTITLPSASKLRLLGVSSDDATALKSVSKISTNYVGISNAALYIEASGVVSSSKVCVVTLQCTDDGGDWYVDISADL